VQTACCLCLYENIPLVSQLLTRHIFLFLPAGLVAHIAANSHVQACLSSSVITPLFSISIQIHPRAVQKNKSF